MIKIIVAATYDGVIGVNNSLPWNIPKEINIFKEKTLNHTVVMGRKTYESLPKSVRPLPNRTNIVLSKSGFDPENSSVYVFNSLEEYLETIKDDRTIWIIGGEAIFKEALKFADEIHLSTIPLDIKGDAFFNLEHHDKLFDVIEEHSYYETGKLLFNIDVYKRR